MIIDQSRLRHGLNTNNQSVSGSFARPQIRGSKLTYFAICTSFCWYWSFVWSGLICVPSYVLISLFRILNGHLIQTKFKAEKMRDGPYYVCQEFPLSVESEIFTSKPTQIQR